MKDILIAVVVLILILGLFWFVSTRDRTEELPDNNMETEELRVETLREGEGEEAQNGDTLTVHYTGMLEDGTVFDASLERGTPFEFVLGVGLVIEGWELGMLGAKVGEVRRLTIPPHLGYGEVEVGNGLIPANSTLIFDVEVLEIN